MKTSQVTAISESLRWLVLAAAVVYCVVQFRAYNKMTTDLASDQLLLLRGSVLISEQLERHDNLARGAYRLILGRPFEPLPLELTTWKASVDSLLSEPE